MLESNTEGCDDDELGIYSVYAVGLDNPTNKGYTVEMTINGSPCAMEVDTAADYSIMSKSTHSQKFSNFPLRPSKVELKIYTGETKGMESHFIPVLVVYQSRYTPPPPYTPQTHTIAYGEMFT